MPIDFSEAVLERAHELLKTDHIKPDTEHAGIWWVLSLDGDNLYRVQTDFNAEKRSLTWITCTCAHGLKAGGGTTRCYHAAAVLVRLQIDTRRTGT